MKKLLSLSLALVMLLSCVLGQAVFVSAADTVDYTNAPYAGVYQVTSDKAVTVSSEIGTVATLNAGGTGYIYLIKGANVLEISDSSANLTFTALANNGLDYLGQVEVSEIPLSHPDDGDTAGNLPLIYEETEGGFHTDNSTYFQLAENASVTFSLNAPVDGLYAIKIQINDAYKGSLKVETDTGFYGIINQSQWGWNLTGSGTHSDAKIDLEMVYLRAGKNTFTMTNVGSTIPTINGISMDPLGHLTSGSLYDQYGYQISLENLKVVGGEAAPEATPTPTPTPTPDAPTGAITYNAPYAGVYAVTTDDEVSVTTEIGTYATLAAGETGYVYLIKGQNIVSVSNNSANLTFSALAHNGLDYLDQVLVDEIPLSHPDDGDTAGDLPLIYEETEGGFHTDNSTFFQLSENAMVTFSLDAPVDGLYAIKLQINDLNKGSLKVETDTGFYGIINQSQWGWNLTGSGTHSDAQIDLELVYLREGTNTFTMTNVGNTIPTICGISMDPLGHLTSGSLLTQYGWQLSLDHLKPIIFADEFSEITISGTTKTATVSYTNRVAEDDGLVSFIIAEYDAASRKLTQVDIEYIDTSLQAMGTTESYSVGLQGATGIVKAMLMDENLVPLKEAVSFSTDEIFPANVLQTPVTYQLASETKTASGEYYSDEYGLHNASYDIDAIFYDGSVVNGNKSQVFAYMGFPKGASEDNPVPAVVLVHGGLGKAEIDWVKKWNDRGYAAIAMDLYSKGPDKNTIANPGVSHPWNDDGKAFLKDYEKANMYHVVINVINAHSLIRSFPQVDAEKTGITGISWGGITTTLTAGVDNRFSFAAPVYGCGCLDQSRTYFAVSYDASDRTDKWDPINFAAKADIPFLFVNSDIDPHFSLDATSLSAQAVKNGTMSIHHNLGHSQYTGMNIDQIYDFADRVLAGDENPYMQVVDATSENGVLNVSLDIPEELSISGVKTYYITEDEIPWNGEDVYWTTITDYTRTADGFTVTLPSAAKKCYASITDNNGNIVSAPLTTVNR